MRVLVLSSFTKSLLWFRMDLMDELVAKGHEVIALGSDDDEYFRSQFASHGIDYRSFAVSRNGLSPLQDVRTYLELRRAFRDIAPDRTFVYQAKSIIYGCLAARHVGIDGVYPLVAGLGSVFRDERLKNRAIRALMRLQYRMAFRFSPRVFFQNADDSSEFVSTGLVHENQVVMLNGSGVNLAKFSVKALPEVPTFLFVGRLIKDKGIVEYLEACAQLKRICPDVRCLLVGPYDSNPSSLSAEELRPYVRDGVVEYLGELDDVRPALAECSVFVLPSYHEGTPKSVLEAMAMGRAIITTDAPGCRETVVDGCNGTLVKPRSVGELVREMARFAEEPDLVGRMGAESRAIAEDRYDVRKVNAAIMATMSL